MKCELTYFRTIDLSKDSTAKDKIQDVLRRILTDPVKGDVVDGPVCLHYVRYKEFRMLSEETIESMLRFKQSRLDYINQCENDPSRIALALAEAKDLTPLEMDYKAFLNTLIAHQLNYNDIVTLCELFEEKWHFYYEVDPTLSNKELFASVRSYLSEANQPRFDAYATCFTRERMNDVLSISSFVTSLANKQNLVNQYYLEYKESLGELEPDQVRCPVTREIIDGKKSLASKGRAENFLAMAFVLAKMAGLVEETPCNTSPTNENLSDDINAFLSTQSRDYLQQCEQKLYYYLQQPRNLGFTPMETHLLLEMGVANVKLIFKGNYSHLWSRNAPPRKNARDLLSDYSKLDWFYPALSLFFTGHLKRNHHIPVKQAVEALSRGDGLGEVLNTLEAEARKHPLFNEEGSLMRRLRFIDMHIGPRQGSGSKTVTEEITLVVN